MLLISIRTYFRDWLSAGNLSTGGIKKPTVLQEYFKISMVIDNR